MPQRGEAAVTQQWQQWQQRSQSQLLPLLCEFTSRSRPPPDLVQPQHGPPRLAAGPSAGLGSMLNKRITSVWRALLNGNVSALDLASYHIEVVAAQHGPLLRQPERNTPLAAACMPKRAVRRAAPRNLTLVPTLIVPLSCWFERLGSRCGSVSWPTGVPLKTRVDALRQSTPPLTRFELATR